MAASNMSLLIRKVKVIDTQSPFHNKIVDILIENGKIASIASSITSKAKREINHKGLHISPGFVDVFADYCEPGYEHKETLQSGLLQAVAGGYTEVFLAPNTQPTLSNKTALEYILKNTENDLVTVHPIGSITQKIEGKALAEMYDMNKSGAIAFSDGWHPVQHPGLMLKALEYVKAFQGILIQLPLDESLAVGGLMHEGQLSTKLGMPGIPNLAETTILHRDIELLRYTQSRLHITGISTEEGVNMIRKAKKEGLQITCSVTPYHLMFNDSMLKDYNSLYKVCPVLRSEKDRLALIKGLKEGTIDCIASHHRPQDWDAKVKEFEYAADGMNVQQITASILLSELSDKLPLERIIEAMTTAPRAIFGLEKVDIMEGSSANCCLYLPETSFTVETENLYSQSQNNPFIGATLKGKIIGTIHKNQSQFKY